MPRIIITIIFKTIKINNYSIKMYSIVFFFAMQILYDRILLLLEYICTRKEQWSLQNSAQNPPEAVSQVIVIGQIHLDFCLSPK